MTGRCMFGHLVIDDSKKCPRCFPDYGGGVEDVSNKNKPIPLVEYSTPIHHSKKMRKI